MQVIAHIASVGMIMYGTTEQFWAALGVYFCTGCLGMRMTFHAGVSHRSWKMPEWFKPAGVICGTLGLVGSIMGWGAVHREHHHHTDTELDPHSPAHKGFIWVQWFSMFAPPKMRYIRDMLRDPLLTWAHRNYWNIHLVWVLILTLIDTLTFSFGDPQGVPALVYLYLFPAAILWNAGSLVNTVEHTPRLGYRTYDTPDHSVTNWLVGLITWGEFHNPHHDEPNNPRFGRRWWEPDIGWYLIWLLQKR